MSDDMKREWQALEAERIRADIDIRRRELDLREQSLRLRHREPAGKSPSATLIVAVISLLGSLGAATIALRGSMYTADRQVSGAVVVEDVRFQEARAAANSQLAVAVTNTQSNQEAAKRLLLLMDAGILQEDSTVRSRLVAAVSLVEGQSVPAQPAVASTKPPASALLTQLITSEVAQRSGIDNEPPSEARKALELLEQKVLRPISGHFGKPLRIVAGYRSPELNKIVGGTPGSPHVRGEAADIQIEGVPPCEIARWVADSGLDTDQIILEFGKWVHVAYTDRGRNRGERLTLSDVTTGYRTGLNCDRS
jgi:zinc D-Ala-D-Ala carboxypeptidase